MSYRTLISSVALALLVAACGGGPQVTSPKLPLRRVVVYRNGVGYFERSGQVDDTEVHFKMRQQAVGDFLATLAIVERGGSSVRSASFPIEVADKFEPVPPPACSEDGKCPAPKPEPPKERNPLREVSLRLDGKEHDLAVGYVAETPVWRPSYRVVVGSDGSATLQSWGIVQNLSGEDWKDVELVLVAGAPLAFRSTLGQPVTPDRPTVTDTGEVITSVPEGVTSLEALAGGAVNRYVPEEQAPAPESPVVADAEYAMRDEGGGAEKSKKEVVAAAKPSRMAMTRAASSSGRTSKAGDPLASGRGMGAPPPPPAPAPMMAAAPSAPRNVSILAGVAVEGGNTHYQVPYRITVPDESATMVLLSNEKVPGESVFLFAPDGGVSDSAKHPFRVARFTNATRGMLERGPIAVFEQGSFLGQGMLDSLPPGARATVPFALERGLAVEQTTNRDERGSRLFKIAHGQLTVERDTVLLTTYKITNGTKEATKVLVRHARQPGTRLFRPPAGTEDNAALGNALLPIAAAAGGKAELVVDERTAVQQAVGWLDPLADDAVKGYLADSRAEPKPAQQLGQAWQVRGAWKKLVDEQSRLETERGELERNLSQLRSSLKAIEKNTQAMDLRQKLTRKLGESSTRLDEITRRLVEVELAMREQEVRFRDAVTDIQILTALPPRD